VDCRDCNRRLALLALPHSEPGAFVCLRHKPLGGRKCCWEAGNRQALLH
jgi:hypothetical protein